MSISLQSTLLICLDSMGKGDQSMTFFTITRAHFHLIGVVGVDPVTHVTWDSDQRSQTQSTDKILTSGASHSWGIGAGSAALLGFIHDELRYSLVGIKQSNKIFFVNLKFTKRIDSTMSLLQICGMIFKEVSSINPRELPQWQEVCIKQFSSYNVLFGISVRIFITSYKTKIL